MKFQEEAWSSEAGKPVGLPGRGSYLEGHKRKEFQKTEGGEGPPKQANYPSQGLPRSPVAPCLHVAHGEGCTTWFSVYSAMLYWHIKAPLLVDQTQYL